MHLTTMLYNSDSVLLRLVLWLRPIPPECLSRAGGIILATFAFSQDSYGAGVW